MTNRNNNNPPMPSVYPDYEAPVIVTANDGSREMRNLRWGMPTSKQALFKTANERVQKLRTKGIEFDFAELLTRAGLWPSSPASYPACMRANEEKGLGGD